MARVPFPFTGPAYKSVSVNINAQECVNFIRDIDAVAGRGKVSLLGRWGMTLYATTGAEPVRGIVSINSIAYFVAGSVFYQMKYDGTLKSYPLQLTTNSGRVGIAHNGVQVMVVDGVKGYIYTIADNTFVEIVAAGFLGGIDVTYVDGYFIIVNPSSQYAESSSLLDGTSWNAVDKSAVEGYPDNLIRSVNVHGDLWMFGVNSTEVWYDAANPVGFPFSRYGGAVIKFGLSAAWSAIAADDTIYWLANSLDGYAGIVRARGYAPEKVSTAAMDAEIARYGNISDCEAWTFADLGHTFVVFDFPTANKTWLFDAYIAARLGNEYAWSELRSYGLGRFRANKHFTLGSKHILCDSTTGKLYQVNWDRYDDNGDVIEGIRTTQHVSNNNLPVEINRLQVDMQKGVGLKPADPDNPVNVGEDPQAMLSASRDGGNTYGNEVWRSMGKQGQYGYGSVWTRLGTAENWTLRLRITDPVKRVIIGATADIEVGLS